MADRIEPIEPIEIGEALARLDCGEDFLLLDVRNDEEYEAWRFEARQSIETLHVPYFEFIESPEAAIARIPEGRETLVLCAKGGSSEMVAGLLTEAGRSARNLAGGMIAYGDHVQVVRVPAVAPAEIFQLNRRGKGCLSYLVRSGPDAIVVDPARRVGIYAELARQEGCTIRFVLDTHVHADHLSGRRELARLVEAEDSVEPGSRIELDGGRLQLRALASPGHTPESMLYLLGETHLFAGDTLFVSGVGRPDLGGEVEAWGRELFETLRKRIADLSDETVVLPAHYGTIAEIGPEGIVSGRLGDLRSQVPEMKIPDERTFVEAMRAAVREAPAAYERILQANRGLETPSEEEMLVLELGKNRCAAEARGAV